MKLSYGGVRHNKIGWEMNYVGLTLIRMSYGDSRQFWTTSRSVTGAGDLEEETLERVLKFLRKSIQKNVTDYFGLPEVL